MMHAPSRKRIPVKVRRDPGVGVCLGDKSGAPDQGDKEEEQVGLCASHGEKTGRKTRKSTSWSTIHDNDPVLGECQNFCV